MFLDTLISIKLWCLYLVQHMLHQIKHHDFKLINLNEYFNKMTPAFQE